MYKGIFIAVLAGRETIHRSTTAGLMDTVAALVRGEMPYRYTLHTDSAPLQYIRSEVANNFLHNSDMEWLLFIDDDIGFSAKDLNHLLAVGEKLVVGACPFRELNPKRTLMYLPLPGTYNKDKTAIEIANGGMGFTLIHREVFTTIKDKFPELEYIPIGRPESLTGKTCHNYFETIIENRVAKTEDVSFCERYRATGGKVWLALDTNLTHSGMHTFTFPKPVRELISSQD